MNREIEKAIAKAETGTYSIRTTLNNVRKWWGKNGYKVFRVILFPFWIMSIISEKIQNYLNSHQQWNEERANEILNYYIPRKSTWDKEEKSFYFFDNGGGWCFGSAKYYLKRKDRRFWKCNNGFYGGEIRRYLINSFELEGFTKTLGICEDGWTEITFTLIKEDIDK